MMLFLSKCNAAYDWRVLAYVPEVTYFKLSLVRRYYICSALTWAWDKYLQCSVCVTGMLRITIYLQIHILEYDVMLELCNRFHT